MADVSLNESDEVTIADAAGVNKLTVMLDGSIVNLPHIAYMNQTLKMYQSAFEVNSATSSENSLILFRNPAGSGKTVSIEAIYALLTNTVGSQIIYRWYSQPTVTSVGTSQAKTSMYFGGGAPASSINIYTLPTISANGTRVGSGLAIGGTSGGQVYHREYNGTVILAPGQDILLTGQGDGTNRNSCVTFHWSEV